METSETIKIDEQIAKIEKLDHFVNASGVYLEEGNEFGNDHAAYRPSDNWAQGGPLIEKHEVLLDIVTVKEQRFWQAMKFNGCTVSIKEADTPLMAVMLAIIAGHNQDS